MSYYVTRKNEDIVEYLDSRSKRWKSYFKIKQGLDCGYKTEKGATKKLIEVQAIIKEYFNKSSLESIRSRNIDDFLYLSRIDH